VISHPGATETQSGGFPRALAGWAFATALVIIPIGAALGGAGRGIRLRLFCW